MEIRTSQRNVSVLIIIIIFFLKGGERRSIDNKNNYTQIPLVEVFPKKTQLVVKLVTTLVDGMLPVKLLFNSEMVFGYGLFVRTFV